MHSFLEFFDTLYATIADVAPIAGILLAFQVLVLRRKVKHPGQMITGFVLVLLGLAFFLEGWNSPFSPLARSWPSS